jgi:hypothetical protein
MDMKKLLEAVTKFAGEPKQKSGDQVQGTDVAKKSSKEHPFKGQLVGDSVEPNSNMLEELAQEAQEKTLEWDLAEAYAKFMEDDLGVEPKRPSRKGSRHARGHEPQPQYKEVEADKEIDEVKHFRTAYGWAGGRNEKTGGTYKHPDQVKADREAKKAAKKDAAEPAVDEARTTWNNDFYVYDPKTLTVKKKFRTHKGAKQYAEANGLKVASAEYYHDTVSKEVDEGWESGPEERSSGRGRDPDDAYDDMRQQKADDEAERQQAKRPQEKYYTLTGRGPNMEPNYAFSGEYATLDDAVAARTKLMADPSTPNPRMIGINTRTRYLDLKEGIESADPVESAVLSAVQELIQQGHTEVAPEVITNMVVAATSQPFLLKDLVDANKNSSAIQHYVDSINPTKVKFSSDILTVKNENPAKKSKEQSQAGVANMAARAAGRNRLGEASTPLRDREDYDAKNKALQDIQMDPSTSQDPQLSAELARRKAELVQQAKQLGISESRAHKLIANKLKQIELQRQMGSPESEAEYANHIDCMKKSKEEYLKNTPNTIYKREIDEMEATGQTSMADKTGTNSPQQAAKVAQATSALKSATGSSAPAPVLAKALDAATQGKPVGAADMQALEPMMDVIGAAAQDPKLANQFKTLANQARQTQQQPKV